MTGLARLEDRIAKLVWIHSKGLPCYVEAADLRQEAMLGALEALRRYDKRRGATPMTWALHGAHGAIRHYIREQRQIRGLPGWRQERGETEVREFHGGPMDMADDDGLADRIVSEMVVREFIKQLPEPDAAVCEGLLEGQTGEAIAANAGLSGNTISHRRTRHLQRRLRGYLTQLRYEEARIG